MSEVIFFEHKSSNFVSQMHSDISALHDSYQTINGLKRDPVSIVLAMNQNQAIQFQFF
ncbi:MAG: hypothetical protein PV340_05500 [Wolbachia sp.]|nr:hypothetical protein [Wolbachia sp.]MDD9336123.1 hypothetical protein [Wolbachia sp.]